MSLVQRLHSGYAALHRTHDCFADLMFLLEMDDLIRTLDSGIADLCEFLEYFMLFLFPFRLL